MSRLGSRGGGIHGFRVSGFEFRVDGSRFGVWGPELRIQGSGFRVQGVGFRSTCSASISGSVARPTAG